MTKRALVAISVLCATLSLSGCEVSGLAVPDPATMAPVTADVLGDLATFDACDLVTLTDLMPYGAPMVVDAENLDNCAYRVAAPDPDDPMTVSIGDLTSELPPSRGTERYRELPGGIAQTTRAQTPRDCEQLLAFAGGPVFRVLVTNAEENRSCEVANTVAGVFARRLVSGKPIARMNRRPGSLAAVDPCPLLTDDVLAPLPALAGAKRRSAPARHVCSLASADGGTTLEVRFGGGSDLEWTYPQELRQDIAGRVTAKHFSVVCSMITEQLRTAQIRYRELATVAVRTPDLTSCEKAAAVAERLWPKLPAKP
ncbi:hypothetical protein V5P93_005160 [Actinokineospora auranticolor]|uniref:DUF3558 domain-containing protein n=1 Tax=Actinokineospora auranticolor TaxID=155976 RepID=A0A2S6GKL3_9PSEU|nr:hypothetical protein [Actinokineospora auranticolor]PPK65691.1 hypothetical protein CLV40_113175 [Actinokineospora auranticolor]